MSHDFDYTLMHDEVPEFFLETGGAYKSVQNLDRFLAKVYSYFLGKGFWTMATAKFLNLLTLLWVIFFTTFLVSCIDYSILFETYRLSQAVVSPSIPPFLWICLFIFCVFFLWQFVQFMVDTRENWDIKQFYNNELKISEDELQTIEWRVVVQKIIQIRGLCRVKSEPMTPLDIANRIMRKENYLIALINKRILALNIPFPFLKKRSIVTKTLEWSLSYTIFNYVFDPKNRDGLNKQVLDSGRHHELAEGLRRRFKIMGLLSLILSPFIFIFLFIYFVFKYGEEIRNRPGTSVIATRHWSPLAHWKFRELNELPHVFQRRLNASYSLAEEYVASFPFNMLTVIARFISFIVGSIVVILLLIGLWDDNALFQLEVFDGKSAIWLVGVGGTIIAACRGFIPEENIVRDPERIMEQLVQHTHYIPKAWRGRTNSMKVLNEFTQLFEYKFVIFLSEMLSVLFAPFILLFSLTESADDIIRFFREFTVHEPGVGDVCKFAVFPLEEHGNSSYGVDSRCTDKHLRTKQGKMEKSFLNFKANYPEWQPSKDGQKYLVNLSSIVSANQAGTPSMPNIGVSNSSNIAVSQFVNAAPQFNNNNNNNNKILNMNDDRNNNNNIKPGVTYSDPGQSALFTSRMDSEPTRYTVEDSIQSLNLIHRHFYNSQMNSSDPVNNAGRNLGTKKN